MTSVATLAVATDTSAMNAPTITAPMVLVGIISVGPALTKILLNIKIIENLPLAVVKATIVLLIVLPRTAAATTEKDIEAEVEVRTDKAIGGVVEAGTSMTTRTVVVDAVVVATTGTQPLPLTPATYADSQDTSRKTAHKTRSRITIFPR